MADLTVKAGNILTVAADLIAEAGQRLAETAGRAPKDDRLLAGATDLIVMAKELIARADRAIVEARYFPTAPMAPSAPPLPPSHDAPVG